ncbi:MAG: amidohydrolase [Candidatus Thermoplasmatota archaeon]|nr:amidohydrolase [Candidatus Thermoplasmatota archaeon]MBS3790747.1 amidohydrolase [Candidatus Thermoplasmatota archaeon]
MSIAIKNAELIGEEWKKDVLIEDGEIKSISQSEEGEKTIDAEGKYLSPGFFNTHTHAAMTLFRGVADDRDFWDAWPNIVWPLEENLTEEDVYWGTKLACLEMIKTGTVAFNDMYFSMESALDAVEEMGMKAVLSYGLIDQGDPEKLEQEKEATKRFVRYAEDSELVEAAVGPHSVYTVSEEGLQWSADFANKKNLLVHTHLAETKKERDDFKEEHEVSFTEYLDEFGLLNERTVVAHCVWLEAKDYELLSNQGAFVSHNPSSNMKLGVGKPMNYEAMKDQGVKVTLATDGCVSNNNLDMLEEAKTAALQQKMSGDATLLNASEVYEMLTEKGAEAMGIDSGRIEEGAPADLILIRKDVKAMPDHYPKSNLIYSMSGSSVTDVMIDGNMVMRDREVEDEKKIMKNADERAKDLVSRVK